MKMMYGYEIHVRDRVMFTQKLDIDEPLYGLALGLLVKMLAEGSKKSLNLRSGRNVFWYSKP